MKKNGFMLAEVLIISTLLIGVMTFMYTQIRSLNNAYSREFKYNTVDGLYGARVLKEYLDTKYNFNTLNTTEFINKNTLNSNYFNKLTQKLGVLKIVITNNNANVYNYLTNNYNINSPYIGTDTSYYEKMIEFSTTLDHDNKKHIIVAYEDGTFCDYKF